MDWLTGLISGGLNLLGTSMQNDAAEQRQQEANAFNAQQAQINRDWSAGQSAITRDYNALQAETSRNFDANQASIAREFNAAQAGQAQNFTERMQDKAAAYNSAEAQNNRVWQTSMSNTAYQRSVADMRAAGLNPILAAGASPASTPGGSTASIGGASGTAASAGAAHGATASAGAASAGGTPAAHAAPVANLLHNAVSSAVEYEKLQPTIEAIRAGTNLTKQDEEKRKKETQKAHSEAESAAIQTQIDMERMKVAKREGYEAQRATDFYNENPKVGAALGTAKTITGDIAPVVSSARQFMGLISQRPF